MKVWFADHGVEILAWVFIGWWLVALLFGVGCLWFVVSVSGDWIDILRQRRAGNTRRMG